MCLLFIQCHLEFSTTKERDRVRWSNYGITDHLRFQFSANNGRQLTSLANSINHQHLITYRVVSLFVYLRGEYNWSFIWVLDWMDGSLLDQGRQIAFNWNLRDGWHCKLSCALCTERYGRSLLGPFEFNNNIRWFPSELDDLLFLLRHQSTVLIGKQTNYCPSTSAKISGPVVFHWLSAGILKC